MKDFLLRLSLAVALTLLVFALSPSANSQPTARGSAFGGKQASNPGQAQQNNEPEMPASGQFTTHDAKTFSGEIAKVNGEFVLKDPVTKVIYKLSDRSRAQAYKGKRVKVTGKLEMNSNTILVESIEPTF